MELAPVAVPTGAAAGLGPAPKVLGMRKTEELELPLGESWMVFFWSGGRKAQGCLVDRSWEWLIRSRSRGHGSVDGHGHGGFTPTYPIRGRWGRWLDRKWLVGGKDEESFVTSGSNNVSLQETCW